MTTPLNQRGVIDMVKYRIPDFQEQWRQARTRSEREGVLVRWAQVTGLLNNAPDIFEDFDKILRQEREAA